MKHFRLGYVLLFIGVGLLLGQATAELTAFQNLVPSANVGEMVTVTVSLTYNGQTPTQAVVTPSLPFGVVANAGSQSTDLYPGITQQISYPLTAEQSGSYWIVSDISYDEGGAWRNLRLEAPFTAIDSVVPEPRPMPEQTPEVPPPGIGQDGSNPNGTDPFAMPPDLAIPQDDGLPDGKPPGDMGPGNNGEDAPTEGEGPAESETTLP